MNPGYRVLDNLYTWIIEDVRIWRRHHEVLEDLQQSIIQDTIAKRSKVKELDTLLNPKPLGPRKVWEAVKPFHIQHWDWFLGFHYYLYFLVSSSHFHMPLLLSAPYGISTLLDAPFRISILFGRCGTRALYLKNML